MIKFIVHIRLICSQCSAIVPPYYIFACTILLYSIVYRECLYGIHLYINLYKQYN